MLDGHHKAPEPADLTLTGPQRSLKKRMLTVLEHLEAGHSRASAAAAAGVGVSRVKQWYQHGLTKVTHPLYPWFRQELERSEGSGESIFANILEVLHLFNALSLELLHSILVAEDVLLELLLEAWELNEYLLVV